MKNDANRANTIGSRIRLAREELGISQSALAEKLGFKSATAISLIESGERGIPTSMLERLSSVLHCDIDYLLGTDTKATDVRVALRSDKDLSQADKDAILRFIELAKKKKKDAR